MTPTSLGFPPGYVHLEELQLYDLFDSGVLERISGKTDLESSRVERWRRGVG